MHLVPYQALIAQHSDHDPRLIEGLMRLGSPTLDALSLEEFKREIHLAEALVREVGMATAQRYAGLNIAL